MPNFVEKINKQISSQSSRFFVGFDPDLCKNINFRLFERFIYQHAIITTWPNISSTLNFVSVVDSKIRCKLIIWLVNRNEPNIKLNSHEFRLFCIYQHARYSCDFFCIIVGGSLFGIVKLVADQRISVGWQSTLMMMEGIKIVKKFLLLLLFLFFSIFNNCYEDPNPSEQI